MNSGGDGGNKFFPKLWNPNKNLYCETIQKTGIIIIWLFYLVREIVLSLALCTDSFLHAVPKGRRRNNIVDNGK